MSTARAAASNTELTEPLLNNVNPEAKDDGIPPPPPPPPAPPVNNPVAAQQAANISRWGYFGKFLAAAFAVGCGITTVAALVSTAGMIAPAFAVTPWFYAIAASLFGASTFANYRMSRSDVPAILSGGIRELVNTSVTVNGVRIYTPLSAGRKMILFGGILLSATFGIAIGVLTVSSTLALPLAFGFLGAVSVAIPPVGIFFGIVTAICITVVMARQFSKLSKANNIWGTIKGVLADLFLPHPVKDQGKSTARFLCERIPVWIVLVAITVGSLGLAFWGETYTLKSCATGLAGMMSNLIHGASNAVNVLNTVVIRGFALVAQVPFTIRTTLNPILQLFSRKTPAEKQLEQEIFERDNPRASTGTIETMLGAAASTENAIGNGLVALSGKPLNAMSIIGTIGATINSFYSTFGNTIPDFIPSSQLGAPAANPGLQNALPPQNGIAAPAAPAAPAAQPAPAAAVVRIHV